MLAVAARTSGVCRGRHLLAAPRVLAASCLLASAPRLLPASSQRAAPRPRMLSTPSQRAAPRLLPAPSQRAQLASPDRKSVV